MRVQHAEQLNAVQCVLNSKASHATFYIWDDYFKVVVTLHNVKCF